MAKMTMSNFSLIKRDQEVDFISKLPAEIIISILCGLSNMEEVARTSILSRRWHKLWTFIPICNFDSHHKLDLFFSRPNYASKVKMLVHDCLTYIKWVNRVLESHDPAAESIHQIRVRFLLNSQHTDDIDRLITFAIQNSVPWLELDFSPFPASIGYGNQYKLTREPFSSNNFLKLRVLRLTEIDLSDDLLNHILFNSPCLEQLYVFDASSLTNIKITAPSSLNLTHFEMHRCFRMKKIEISQTRLVSLALSHWSRIELVLKNLPQLVDVSIRFGSGFPLNEMRLLLSNYLLQVKKLVLIIDNSDNEEKSPGELVKWPTLSNLRHLELVFALFGGKNIHPVMSFLEASPFMHTLKLQFAWIYHDSLRIYPERKTPEITHRKNSYGFLKLVELRGYVGDTEDAEIATSLLENAKSVNKLIVTLSNLERAGIESEYLERENRLTKESAIQLGAQIPPGAQLQVLHPPHKELHLPNEL